MNLRPRKNYRSRRGHVPEDRHKYGLILEMTLAENIALQTYYQELMNGRIKLR